MQVGQIILVTTDPTSQFTGALAQNATLGVDLKPYSGTGTTAGFVDQGLGGTSVKSRLRGITVSSVDNLAWEVDLFGDAVAGLTSFLGGWRFLMTDGLQFGGAGNFLYYKGGLDIPYLDNARTGQIHLVLCNRSAGGKSGAITIGLHLEPAYGQ